MMIIVNPNGFHEEYDKNDIAVAALSDAINKGTVTVDEVLKHINK